MKQVELIPIFFCLSLLISKGVLAADISVTDSWIRKAPPGAQVLGAYMMINNQSNHTVTLKSVSSPCFHKVQIHLTKMHDGMVHMLKQPNLQIEPAGSVALEPGGYHLMLMRPVRSLHAGDKVKLQLHFDNEEVIDVTAVVRKK